MKIKEPTRRHKIPRSHKIPSSGKSWMKRQMRKPYRVMFWILVVCWGFALVGGLMMYLDSKNEVANNNIIRHKTTVVSEKKVVISSQRPKRRKSLSPEQQLAIMSKKEYLPASFVEREYGDGLPEDDILVVRFRYLLQNLEKHTIQSKQEIVHITETAQLILRNKYGRTLRVKDLVEGMNRMISSYPSDEAVDYSNLMAIYVETLK
jgi:hypothetical protein